jgi:magnesium chelatase family protein
VNLAPADRKKMGPWYDLPMALGILAVSEQVELPRLPDFFVAGELSLDGRVRPIRGALLMADHARRAGARGVIVPAENANEAAMAGNAIDVIPVEFLHEAVGYLSGDLPITPATGDPEALLATPPEGAGDFNEVRGHAFPRRALTIAAAGGHNVLMVGPPGSGKTMMARRLPTILPPLTLDEALEATRIYSVAGKLSGGEALVRQRPFRSPHHSVSDPGLIGGGTIPVPGEISLAHHGVLFLDELTEFRKGTLEMLRQPLEDGDVTISRAAASVKFPSRCQLVAATNPCPCGYAGAPGRRCTCMDNEVRSYFSRISGPLLDRVDIHIEVNSIPVRDLAGGAPAESSADMRARVIAARARQQERFRETPHVSCNAAMGERELTAFIRLSPSSESILQRAVERVGLSTRAYSRIKKVARTIADLAGEAEIADAHVAEAIALRSIDKHLM